MNGHIIRGTAIAVDYWMKDPGKYVYFLTHCHTDHLNGLTASWNKPIYTSDFNVWWLKKFYKLKPSLLIELDIGETHVVKEPGGHEFSVTVIEANHCPGAVMFLFRGHFGTILYTGDFRYYPELLENEELKTVVKNETLDVLYLDNTYASTHCEFPGRNKARKEIISIVRNHPEYMVLIGLHNLGKEDLLRKIALKLNEPVYVSERRMEVIKKLKYENVFTTDPKESRIHVVDRSLVNINYMRRKRKEDPNTIAILPTALLRCGNGKVPLPFNKSENHGIYVVAYSDHSSHSELHEFVSQVKPIKLIPIVKSNLSSISNYTSYWQYLKTISVIPDSLKSLCQKVKYTKPKYDNDDVEDKVEENDEREIVIRNKEEKKVKCIRPKYNQGENIEENDEGGIVLRNWKEKKVKSEKYMLRKKRIPKASDKKGVYYESTSSSEEEFSETEYEDDSEGREEILVTLPSSTSVTVKAPQNVKNVLNDLRVKVCDVSQQVIRNNSSRMESSQNIKDVRVQLVDIRKQKSDGISRISPTHNVNDSDEHEVSGSDNTNAFLGFSIEETLSIKDALRQEKKEYSDSNSINSATTLLLPYDSLFEEKNIKVEEEDLDIKYEEVSSHGTEQSTDKIDILWNESLSIKRERESDDESEFGNTNFEGRRKKRRKISSTSQNGNLYLTSDTDAPGLLPKILSIQSLTEDLVSSTQHPNREVSSPSIHIETQSHSLDVLNLVSGSPHQNFDPKSGQITNKIAKQSPKKPVTKAYRIRNSSPVNPVTAADNSQNSEHETKLTPENPHENSNQVSKYLPEKQIPAGTQSRDLTIPIPEKPLTTASSNESCEHMAKQIHDRPVTAACTNQSSNQVKTHVPERPVTTDYRDQDSDQAAKQSHETSAYGGQNSGPVKPVTAFNNSKDDDQETKSSLETLLRGSNQVSKSLRKKPLPQVSQSSDLTTLIPEKPLTTTSRSDSCEQMAKQIHDKPVTADYENQSNQVEIKIAKRQDTTDYRNEVSNQVVNQSHETSAIAAYGGQNSDPVKPVTAVNNDRDDDHVTKSILEIPLKASNQVLKSLPKKPLTTASRSDSYDQIPKQFNEKPTSSDYTHKRSDQSTKTVYVSENSEQVTKSVNNKPLTTDDSQSTEHEFYSCPLAEEEKISKVSIGILSHSQSEEDHFFSFDEELASQTDGCHRDLESPPHQSVGSQLRLSNLSAETEVFNCSKTTVIESNNYIQSQDLSHAYKQMKITDETNKIQDSKELTSETNRKIQSLSTNSARVDSNDRSERDSSEYFPKNGGSKRITNTDLANKSHACEDESEKIDMGHSSKFIHTTRNNTSINAINTSPVHPVEKSGENEGNNERNISNNYWENKSGLYGFIKELHLLYFKSHIGEYEIHQHQTETCTTSSDSEHKNNLCSNEINGSEVRQQNSSVITLTNSYSGQRRLLQFKSSIKSNGSLECLSVSQNSKTKDKQHKCVNKHSDSCVIMQEFTGPQEMRIKDSLQNKHCSETSKALVEENQRNSICSTERARNKLKSHNSDKYIIIDSETNLTKEIEQNENISWVKKNKSQYVTSKTQKSLVLQESKSDVCTEGGLDNRINDKSRAYGQHLQTKVCAIKQKQRALRKTDSSQHNICGKTFKSLEQTSERNEMSKTGRDQFIKPAKENSGKCRNTDSGKFLMKEISPVEKNKSKCVSSGMQKFLLPQESSSDVSTENGLHNRRIKIGQTTYTNKHNKSSKVSQKFANRQETLVTNLSTRSKQCVRICKPMDETFKRNITSHSGRRQNKLMKMKCQNSEECKKSLVDKHSTKDTVPTDNSFQTENNGSESVTVAETNNSCSSAESTMSPRYDGYGLESNTSVCRSQQLVFADERIDSFEQQYRNLRQCFAPDISNANQNPMPIHVLKDLMKNNTIYVIINQNNNNCRCVGSDQTEQLKGDASSQSTDNTTNFHKEIVEKLPKFICQEENKIINSSTRSSHQHSSQTYVNDNVLGHSDLTGTPSTSSSCTCHSSGTDGGNPHILDLTNSTTTHSRDERIQHLKRKRKCPHYQDDVPNKKVQRFDGIT